MLIVVLIRVTSYVNTLSPLSLYVDSETVTIPESSVLTSLLMTFTNTVNLSPGYTGFKY